MEYIHSKRLIHRDIKPANLLIGVNQNLRFIYLVDFGLSKHYEDPRTHLHIPFCTGKTLIGTAHYASLNTHLGCEQERRDDIESMIYTMIYLLKGSLPWQSLGVMSKQERYERITRMKKYIPIEELCNGYRGKFYFNYMVEIGIMLKYVREELDFYGVPNYKYMKTLLKCAFNNAKFEFDYQFDWLGPKILKDNPNLLTFDCTEKDV